MTPKILWNTPDSLQGSTWVPPFECLTCSFQVLTMDSVSNNTELISLTQTQHPYLSTFTFHRTCSRAVEKLWRETWPSLNSSDLPKENNGRSIVGPGYNSSLPSWVDNCLQTCSHTYRLAPQWCLPWLLGGYFLPAWGHPIKQHPPLQPQY